MRRQPALQWIFRLGGLSSAGGHAASRRATAIALCPTVVPTSEQDRAVDRGTREHDRSVRGERGHVVVGEPGGVSDRHARRMPGLEGQAIHAAVGTDPRHAGAAVGEQVALAVEDALARVPIEIGSSPSDANRSSN